MAKTSKLKAVSRTTTVTAKKAAREQMSVSGVDDHAPAVLSDLVIPPEMVEGFFASLGGELPTKPKRKSTLLSPAAQVQLAWLTRDATRTQREAIEQGLALLVEREQRLEAMGQIADEIVAEVGEPTDEEQA